MISRVTFSDAASKKKMRSLRCSQIALVGVGPARACVGVLLLTRAVHNPRGLHDVQPLQGWDTGEETAKVVSTKDHLEKCVLRFQTGSKAEGRLSPDEAQKVHHTF